MQDRKETSQSQLTALVKPRQISTKADSIIKIHELADGNIAVFATKPNIQRFNIYSADLSQVKTKYHFSGSFHGLTLCPNGEMISQRVYDELNVHRSAELRGKRQRVLVDPYNHLEVKKTLEEKVVNHTEALNHACPINANQYIVADGEQSICAIRVFDAKSHEYQTTIDVTRRSLSSYGTIISATALQNGKTAIVSKESSVFYVSLFRYSDHKVSDTNRLCIYDQTHTLRNVDVFPVAENRILIMKKLYHDITRIEKVELEFRNSDAEEAFAEPVTIIVRLKDHIKPQMLLDGSILCCTTANQICIINGVTLKPRYYDAGYDIADLLVLANDRVVVVSKPLGRALASDVKFDIRIIDLDHLINFKKKYITDEIMAVTPFSADVANIVSAYVKGDSNFRYYKHPLCGTFFFPPKTVDEKIAALVKPYGLIVSQLIQKFANEDLSCLQLLVKLRAEMEKPKLDTWEFENTLHMLCEKLDGTNERLSELKRYIEHARGQEDARIDPRLLLAG